MAAGSSFQLLMARIFYGDISFIMTYMSRRDDFHFAQAGDAAVFRWIIAYI